MIRNIEKPRRTAAITDLTAIPAIALLGRVPFTVGNAVGNVEDELVCVGREEDCPGEIVEWKDTPIFYANDDAYAVGNVKVRSRSSLLGSEREVQFPESWS